MHAASALAAEAEKYLPVEQSLHSKLPARSEYFPAGQASQMMLEAAPLTIE
jgi:hypothetical protein